MGDSCTRNTLDCLLVGWTACCSHAHDRYPVSTADNLGKKDIIIPVFQRGVSDLPNVSSRTTISQLRLSHFAATEMSVREERP